MLRIASTLKAQELRLLPDLGADMTWYGGDPVLGAVFSHRTTEAFGNPRASI